MYGQGNGFTNQNNRQNIAMANNPNSMQMNNANEHDGGYNNYGLN